MLADENTIINWLCKNFGAPCDYKFKEDNALDVIEYEWCKRNCRKVSDRVCWMKYFKAIRERREHGAMADGQFRRAGTSDCGGRYSNRAGKDGRSQL